MLANVYLHWFDQVFHFRSGPAHWAKARLVRYADDFVVMARYQGKDLIGFIETKLEEWMGLKLNREKTRVVDLREKGTSLDFLGYSFCYQWNWRWKKRYWRVAPSKGSLKREREKLREMTGRGMGWKPLPWMIAELNHHLRGWANYFSFGHTQEAYRGINWYVQTRLWYHLRGRSQRPYRIPEGQTLYSHLKRMGLVYL